MTEDEMIAAIRQLPVALADKNADSITRILSALIEARARIGGRWRGFAQVLLRQGEIDLAIRAYDLLAAQTTNGLAVQFEKAAALAEKGRVVDAREIVSALPVGVVTHLQRAHFLGVASSQLGRFDDARTYFLEALETDEFSGPTWHSLALITDLAVDHGLADRLIAAAQAAPPEPASNFAVLCYALAKLHDDRGEHGSAFTAVRQGAAMLARARPYDAGADRAEVDALIADEWRISAGTSDAKGDPIFVLGFPRSGTTLVDQILARHPTVGGGGEANLFGQVTEQIGGLHVGAFDKWLSRQVDQAIAVERLRENYIRLMDQRYAGGGRHVDKSLGNSRHIGLMAMVLPSAPLIWLRRNPLDVAWSNFRTYFPLGMEWSLSQAALAEHMANEDRLFAHWRERLGDRLLVVDYELLVACPEETTANIYRHCGLDGAAKRRNPVSEVISTASFAQARRPISQAAVGAADPYRAHLEPFVDRYRQLGGMIAD